MIGYQCPNCGAFLDPGEKCDCQDEAIQKEEENKRKIEALSNLFLFEKTGQMVMAV